MQVWALVQQKGGSDKSKICANLAVLALQERYRWLVTGLKPLLEHLPDAGPSPGQACASSMLTVGEPRPTFMSPFESGRMISGQGLRTGVRPGVPRSARQALTTWQDAVALKELNVANETGLG